MCRWKFEKSPLVLSNERKTCFGRQFWGFFLVTPEVDFWDFNFLNINYYSSRTYAVKIFKIFQLDPELLVKNLFLTAILIFYNKTRSWIQRMFSIRWCQTIKFAFEILKMSKLVLEESSKNLFLTFISDFREKKWK